MNNTDLLLFDYHLHNLILNGIYVDNENPYYDDVKNHTMQRFKRFNFLFAGHRYDTSQRPEEQTPYHWLDGNLYYKKEMLHSLPFIRLENNNDSWGSEQNWYFKTYPGLQEFYELRLNPVNVCANLRYRTGKNKEFRGCVFCQRCYPYIRYSENREIVTPNRIFSELFAIHGEEVVRKIEKVMVMTGDTKTEEQMLQLLEEIYFGYLRPHHFSGTFSVATNVIRTENNIRRLSKLDNRLFEFPIECFSRREEFLGEKKGIPLDEVGAILAIARKYFKYTRINYIVGLDDINSAIRGFCFLVDNQLVDDVIANIFTPFTTQMMNLRQPEANSILYLYAFRDMFNHLGLSPKKTGVTKSLYSHFTKIVMHDELLE